MIPFIIFNKFLLRYGRKPILFVAHAVIVCACFTRSFTQSYGAFLFFRFIDGAFKSGVISTAFVILVELVGPKKRALASNSLWFAFSAWFCLTGLQAYFIQEWRLLEQVLSAPYVIMLIFWM